jgi:hypothetical protein
LLALRTLRSQKLVPIRGVEVKLFTEIAVLKVANNVPQPFWARGDVALKILSMLRRLLIRCGSEKNDGRLHNA